MQHDIHWHADFENQKMTPEHHEALDGAPFRWTRRAARDWGKFKYCRPFGNSMSKGFEESKYGYLRYISLKSLVERDNLPGFLSSYLTKKKLTFEKKFCGWLFLIRVQKKKCHKESWNRDTMRHVLNYVCISFTKTTRQKSHSFFLVCLLKIPGAEWNHLGLGLCQNFHRMWCQPMVWWWTH